MAARQSESATDFEHLSWAFLNAWWDHEPNDEGFCKLEDLLGKILEMGIGRLRHEWTQRPQEWSTCSAILEQIPGFRFTVDRGFLEWNAGPTDRGISHEPCSSERFSRFIRTVITRRPATFEELEDYLP